MSGKRNGEKTENKNHAFVTKPRDRGEVRAFELVHYRPTHGNSWRTVMNPVIKGEAPSLRELIGV